MPQGSILSWLRKSTDVDASRGDATKSDLWQEPLSKPPPAADPATGLSGITHQRAANVVTDPRVPVNVEFRACTKEDIPQLQRLNALLLPASYPPSFYHEILTDPVTNNITLLAFWHDEPSAKYAQAGKLVGALRCRLLSHPSALGMKVDGNGGSGQMLYLSTLALLSPYQNHGIASAMLEVVIRRAVRDYAVVSAGAHVWEANVDALEWYRKRGFRQIDTLPDYYRRLTPSGAVVVRKDISVHDILRDNSSLEPVAD